MSQTQGNDHEEKGPFIPNSCQTPNVYYDEFMPLLTSDEWKVLSYAVRRIFGWQKRRDRISLSQFIKGQTSKKTGQTLNAGTGLSKPTVISCLEELSKYGLMTQTDPGDKAKNIPAEWELQLDYARVDLEGLKKRLEDKSNKARAKTEKGRQAAEVKRLAQAEEAPDLVNTIDQGQEAGNLVNAIDQPWSTPLTSPGQSDRPALVNPIDQQKPLLNQPETNLETQIQPLEAAGPQAGSVVKNPGAFNALAGWEGRQADRQLEGKLQKFPPAVQEVIRALVESFALAEILPSPRKAGGGNFAEWIAQADELVRACHGEARAIQAIQAVAEDFWAETARRDGTPPITISRPRSILAQVAQKAKAIQMKEAQQAQQAMADSNQKSKALEIFQANQGQSLAI